METKWIMLLYPQNLKSVGLTALSTTQIKSPAAESFKTLMKILKIFMSF